MTLAVVKSGKLYPAGPPADPDDVVMRALDESAAVLKRALA